VGDLLAMAGALLIVCLIEWAAGREELTFAQPASAAPVHPVVEAQRSEDTEEHDALGWTAFEEAQEPSDAMTIIGAAPGDVAEAPVAEAEPEPETESEDEPEPELPPAAEEDDKRPEARKRWWRRHTDESGEAEPAAEAPRHVRVLSSEDSDPWEQGFDAPITAEADEVDEDTDEAAQVAEESGRRRFRRR
jgi:hypothetical protein